MRALRLECDSVIVGGGLAGLVACLRLPGRTVLLSGGLGATAVSTGVFSPAGVDPVAEEWFLRLMEDTGCRYVRGECVSALRAVKSGLVQTSTLCDGQAVFISVNEVRPGFKPAEFKKGCSHQEIARILDLDDDAAVELAGLLSGIKADCLLLPPILGIKRADEVRAGLSAALGVEVREYVMAPSVLGLRLISALRKMIEKRNGAEMLDIVKVERVAGGHVEGKMGTKAKREIVVGARNLFIATGGPLTGFKVEGDRMLEPLTGATITTDIEADLNSKFLSEHPLMYKGIGPELFIDGFENARAIGAAACGFGLYKALVSGYRAGEGLER
jgi:glycerol-3-phosphate dehydrogenase subunit B